MKELEIRKYEHKYHQQFKEISLDWLHKHQLYEKADDDLLDHPQKYLEQGSSIFLAHYEDQVVGTISLIPVNEHTYEILKLGVVDGFKGLGIGRKLMQICIDICVEKNVKIITLESSSKLENALKLYEKLGFKHIEVVDAHFESADVKMELKLR
ncbi:MULTISPECIES: GNAT family N-acetyltransferase [unclassified Polaribacter]|uniref:GNAT family N-acetyltransferase n=1 Tax=unclassified Polaribacter TaxID=196858 RepID=UPI0011BFAF55|nr:MULTISPECIES: GNAT family N-acetyltransferase [unclassified Polaribacter]TXD50350.1 GNAT family N-acetyltransferase [Polaribacter sp. IC063]TXD56442.1 GNAT family N-acetyltransferase [Polaribacter sp. IC066]